MNHVRIAGRNLERFLPIFYMGMARSPRSSPSSEMAPARHCTSLRGRAITQEEGLRPQRDFVSREPDFEGLDAPPRVAVTFAHRVRLSLSRVSVPTTRSGLTDRILCRSEGSHHGHGGYRQRGKALLEG
jgi:hypothetical protein